jgi:CheY-like chemotaxis protein
LGYDAGGVGENRSQEPRRHLFVINSSPDFLSIVRDLFDEEGYDVTTSDFAPEVVDQIAALQPDALIVDVAVGETAGWELLERLHAGAATTGIPVLVTSTSFLLLEQARDQAARYGTHHYYLAKPLDLHALLVATREMLGDA